MYVTRPLSMYRKFPNALTAEPPEGPYTGYLVITDEEADAQDIFCWGACKRKSIERLPLPQDKILTLVHTADYNHEVTLSKVLFIPALDQPLSSNHYYVVRANGKYKGQACKSSREAEMGLCCFRSWIKDTQPRPFDYRNIYQQFKIHRYHDRTFFAKSVAMDSIPPNFLRKKGWEVRVSSKSRYIFRKPLTEALGLDTSLRVSLPSFDFSIIKKRSDSNVVGKWYCPFVFVREESRLRRQMRRSIFYQMTLEQWWEKIFSCDNIGEDNNDSSDNNNVVNVCTMVKREVNYVFGLEGIKGNKVCHSGFVWYRGYDRNRKRLRASVGLSLAIVEKMKWLEEEGGWLGGREKEVRIDRVEEMNNNGSGGHGGGSVGGGPRRFGCYVLVESFMLRRMDGSFVLRCDFRHTHRIKCKWE